MALAAGTRLGPYEIVAPLGAGGMGEVYSARDTRLDRTVAIKILPAHLSGNPEARERFEREGRAISSLNHANICQLYDVGHQDGISYLVMELLQGETLADRLRKGPLPLDQVLRFAIDICEGLDKAHRSSVIHRDLKPGNIMLTKTGAKMMDFGLAKTSSMASSAVSGLTETLASPDPSDPLTARGTVLGTYQYMSPEQVEGKELDSRSDIFGFGAVLYEMATGKRAFDGKSQISVASAILDKDPEPITSILPLAPSALDHVVRGCLAKEPDSRWQSASDVARELRWISSSGSQAGVASITRPRRRTQERLIWLSILAVLLAVVLFSNLRDHHKPRVVRAYLLPPKDAPFDLTGDISGPPVLSPDGMQIAFCAHTSNDHNSVWVQSLNSSEAKKLEGTEGSAFPFWSADSKFIAFFTPGKLKKVSATGGPVTIIADAPNGRGGAWNRNNIIVYTPDFRDSIWKVSAMGGQPVRLTNLDANSHTTHRWPTFLPDAKHFLYFATNHSGGNPEKNGIYIASLDDGAGKLLLPTDSQGQYASGFLLYHMQSALVAQKFDPATSALSGDPVPVADHVQYDGGIWHSTFSASEDGMLLYETGAAKEGIDLRWFDRNGKSLGSVGERVGYRGMRISPDSKRLAVSLGDPKPDIWVFDLVGGPRTRLTFDPATHFMPSWSPDGRRIAFMSQTGPTGTFGSTLHAKLANGGGPDELLLEPDKSAIGVALLWPQWSADGRYLLYQQGSGPTGNSVWALPTAGEKKTFPVVQPQSPQASIDFYRLSPDGHWLAYSSNDSGRPEVYVTSFPNPAGRWQVSQSGATFPVWRGDGKELYFSGADSSLYVADVNTKGIEFAAGRPHALFALPYVALAPLGGTPFEVAPDGKRFIIPSTPENASTPVTLVLDWTAELNK